MPTATAWEKTKSGSKKGFDTVYGWVDKFGAPVNKLSNKMGSEAFWPTTLGKESDKAAMILKSFCKDGFYDDAQSTPDHPKSRQKVLKKIPMEVIANAKGLAVFTTMRTGLWVSGAGGSGILVARKADGSWSPPSGIMLHTAGLDFLPGVDIYDCVVVINDYKALDSFTKIRCTLGEEISAVAGPIGVGGMVETELHKRQTPIWTYLKSRGFYAGVQIDGTVIIERTDENERFYGERIGVKDILAGKVRHPPYEVKMLMETIKLAQGDADVDESALPGDGPSPSDMELERRKSIFGVPDMEDPDPFGVHALEKEGFDVLEAGTRTRPSSQQFEYRPSPTSPIFTSFSRRSLDSHQASRRTSWRNSNMSIDRGTQTPRPQNDEEKQERVHDEQNGSQVGYYYESTQGYNEPKELGDDVEKEAREAEEEPAIISKARLVTIRRRTPPILPPRNPKHKIQPLTISTGSTMTQMPALRDVVTGGLLPEKDGYDELALNGIDHPTEKNKSRWMEGCHASTPDEQAPDAKYALLNDKVEAGAEKPVSIIPIIPPRSSNARNTEGGNNHSSSGKEISESSPSQTSLDASK